jgi:glutathione peroxidase
MTIRQSLLKFLYPFITLLSGLLKNGTQTNSEKVVPNSSFYSLAATLNNGQVFSFDSLKGYKVIIVNTASDCGFTAQYSQLEALYQLYKDKLKVIAFPANDFKNQEKGSDKDIASFCKLNYGVSFLLMQKTKVVGSEQNDVFKWLTHKNLNGWCNQQPEWNFCKYLIDENGILLNYFPAAVSPLSKKIVGPITTSH